MSLHEDPTGAQTAAGRLHLPQIPDRSPQLAHTTLGELTSEVLARAEGGSVGESEESILLGLEMDRALRRALDVHNNRFSRRRYRDLYECFFEFVGPPSPPLAGTTIVDLGCGSINPYGLLFLFLMLGAKRGIAIDLDPVFDESRSTSALADLAAEMLVAPGGFVGDHPISREQILSNIASFDLAKLRDGDLAGIDPSHLVHRRESVHALSLGDGEADLIFSNAFFEHIPMVEEAIVELERVTRPGGLGVHVIDCSDHRRYHDSEVHPLWFLTESHSNPLPHGSNRMRPVEFAALFQQHGFEAIQIDCFVRVEVGPQLRSRFIEPYRSMSEDALGNLVAKLVVRRKGA
jgi:SAM-dependent methyltransferase